MATKKTATTEKATQGTVLSGTVVKAAMQKTVVVKVERRFTHPLYKKTIRRSKNYHAHDEKNEFQTNDLVEIVACRPRSKTKRWEVIRLLERPPEV